jgi:hypothetical protein
VVVTLVILRDGVSERAIPLIVVDDDNVDIGTLSRTRCRIRETPRGSNTETSD